MEKIFEMLGLEKLDESKQADLKETLKTVIDVKATELAESKVEGLLETEKDKLKEEYEGKFDEYRDGLTSKFSNFVDTVLDEEMVIPENIVKWAKQGELYHELVEQFKTRLAIDEGMISGEVRGMLKEAKEEIETLRAKVDEATGTNLDLEQDASEMAAQLYVREKCDGLTESQKKHVITLMGDEIIKENIDKKFSIILNTMGVVNESEGEDDEKKDDDKKEDEKVYEMTCESCGNKASIKEEKEEMDCPKCGKSMKAGKVEEGHSVVETKQELMNEDSTPWDTYKAMWINGIKGSSE